jgi:hypothetical protein
LVEKPLIQINPCEGAIEGHCKAIVEEATLQGAIGKFTWLSKWIYGQNLRRRTQVVADVAAPPKTKWRKNIARDWSPMGVQPDERGERSSFNQLPCARKIPHDLSQNE